MNTLLQTAEFWAEKWDAALWRASWQGAIAIAIAWAIAHWCKFLSPRLVCWLWRLACLKVLVALAWAQPLSLAVLPAAATERAAVKPAWSSPARPVVAAESPLFEEPNVPPAPAMAEQGGVTFRGVVFVLWLAGALHSVGGIARQRNSMRRLLSSASIVSSDVLIAVCQQEAERLRVRRAPRLCLSPCVDSPLLTGIWQPAIVLPVSAQETFDAGEVQLMIAHELAHHRRRDLLWNWLPTIVRALFFFHPLVWLLTRRWSEAQEAACDELLIQRRIAQPAEYGRLLLKLAAREPARSRPGLATAGVLGAYRNLEHRILAMTRVQPFSFRRLAIAASIFSLIGGAGLVPFRLAPRTLIAAEDEGAAHVTGRTVAPDGNALGGVRVVLLGNRSETDPDEQVVAEVSSAADGSFDLGEPKTGGVVLAVHPNYAIAWINLSVDAPHDQLTLQLTPPQPRAAIVADENGRPLSGARVWPIYAGGKTESEPQFRDSLELPHFLDLVGGTTGKDGLVVLRNLPKTACQLCAALPGYANGFPAMRDDKERGRLDRFRLSKAARVSGKVLTAEGEPLVGARVTLAADWNYWAFWHATTDENGHYAIGSLPGDGWDMSHWGGGKRGNGQYRVSVASDRYIAEEVKTRLKPGETRDDLDLSTTRGTVVKCRVVEHGSGKPMPKARLAVTSTAGSKNVSADEQGLATFLVSPGEVSLTFFLPGPGVYVRDPGNGGRPTRSFNSTNLEEVSVTLEVAPVEGRLVTLRGDVVGPDGRPVADAVIQPAAGQFVTANVFSYIYAAPSNDKGTFELREVPAGRKLFLYAETRDRAAAGIATVDVPAEPDESFQLHLKLQPTRQASILVAEHAGGETLERPNMPLQISPIVDGETMSFAATRTGRTDADARLEIDGILPGLEYLLRETVSSSDEPAEAAIGGPPARKFFEKRLRLLERE